MTGNRKAPPSPALPIILAVDDTPENLDIIKGVLSKDYQVRVAIDGSLGLKIARSQPVALVLLDIMMPGMNGYEVYEQLQSDKATQDIPVIFVTAMGEVVDEVTGLQLGAVDYIRKPLSAAVLRARVATHLALKNAREELEIKNRVLRDERALVESVLHKMREKERFCTEHLRVLLSPVDTTNGDVVFAAKTPGGCQHVLVGDFTGHGLPAAIGAPLAAQIFYSKTQAGESPEMVLQEVNEVLTRQMPTDTFLAAAFIAVSADRRTLRIWNAGLPDCMLARGEEGDWLAIPSTALPLGIISSGVSFVEKTLPFSMQDRLYVITDGIVEPMNAEGEMFGLERLLPLLSASRDDDQKFEEILEVVEDFAEGGSVDDRTLVEVRP